MRDFVSFITSRVIMIWECIYVSELLEMAILDLNFDVLLFFIYFIRSRT